MPNSTVCLRPLRALGRRRAAPRLAVGALVQAEDGAGRVGQHREATDVLHRRRLEHHARPELLCTGGRRVGVVDGDVRHPPGAGSLVPLLHQAAGLRLAGVEDVVALPERLRRPAHELAVVALGRLGIGGVQLVPHEKAARSVGEVSTP
jgi:hypothetical protein